MDLSSKAYDRIRAARRRSEQNAADTTVMGRTCSWEGCEGEAHYKAPLGRGHEGQYRWFCLDHVREYNKSYNYFQGMSDDDVIAYQRDSLTGHRPTAPIGVRAATAARAARAAFGGMTDDPFGLFGTQQPGGHARPEAEVRRVKGPEREAFEVMGLADTASRDAIKARYKTLVKRHHPDANQGDRSSEDRLRSVITAYTVLRRAGYC